MGNLDAAREIVRDKQAKKVDGMLIDLQTAGAILAVGDALNDVNRARLDALPIATAAQIAWKTVA